MSWLFSRALVEEYLPPNLEGIVSSAPLNVMPTAHKFWRNDKTMEFSDLSRFGLELNLLTDAHGEALLMSYREAFLAKIFPVLERAQDSMANAADYGEKWQGSFARYDRATHTLKTAQCSLIEDLTGCSVTLPRWGLMQRGALSERMPAAFCINASASGSSLPTPSGCRSGKNHVVGRMDEWGGSSNPWRRTEIGKTSSPDFEEWVMGWPGRWTVLTPLEMDKFQQWRQQHLPIYKNN